MDQPELLDAPGKRVKSAQWAEWLDGRTRIFVHRAGSIPVNVFRRRCSSAAIRRAKVARFHLVDGEDPLFDELPSSVEGLPVVTLRAL